MLVVVMAAIVLLSSVSVFGANNPADLTVSYRVCSVNLAKGIYDAGPSSALAVGKISDRSSAMIWAWNSEDGKCNFVETAISSKVISGVEVGLIHDNCKDGPDKNSVMLDLSAKKDLGLGVIIPIGANDASVSFGPRLRSGDWTGYAAVAEGSKPLFGIGRYKNGLSLDLARGKDQFWFRVSKPFYQDKVRITPELRVRCSKGEEFIGFGVAFCK